MKKHSLGIVFTFILILVLGQQSQAQNERWFRTSSLEFGLIGGFSHYSGELTDNVLFESRGFKPCVGLITRYTPHSVLTFRLSAQFGSLEGNDDWFEDLQSQDRRNLDFQSNIWDFTGAAEINLFTPDFRKKSGIHPYVFAGASVFKYDPYSIFEFDANSPHMTRPGSSYADLQSRDGEKIYLQPLGTEGQETTEFNERKRYNLTQLAIPVGAGVKFKFSNNWAMSVEYGLRLTFTDYLDDVSDTYVDPSRLQAQYGAMSAAMADKSPVLHDELLNNERGDPSNKDKYGILGVTLTYRIFGNRPVCPTF
jgi:hypothetical protein